MVPGAPLAFSGTTGAGVEALTAPGLAFTGAFAALAGTLSGGFASAAGGGTAGGVTAGRGVAGAGDLPAGRRILFLGGIFPTN